uniref:Reticulon n=1 Tax=Gasterosteus aculeatus aculeatus TaxID=481459 RepID=A0AAQ4PTI4_GASAC
MLHKDCLPKEKRSSDFSDALEHCLIVLNHLFVCEALGVLMRGGRCCEQDYFGLSGLRTAERAGGGQKQLRGARGEVPGREKDRGCEGAATKMASKAMDLIYWKDTERTGMILTGLVVGLLSLFQLSIITVISTISLAVICFTISVRIYYQVLYILNWGDGEHPFKSYLDLDMSFSGEEADLNVRKAIVMTLSAVDSLKGLFFVRNLVESIKLLVLMYLVTFLGALCNGLTLFIICVIALFSLPLFYRQRQEQFDIFITKIQAHIDNVKDTAGRRCQGAVGKNRGGDVRRVLGADPKESEGGVRRGHRRRSAAV